MVRFLFNSILAVVLGFAFSAVGHAEAANDRETAATVPAPKLRSITIRFSGELTSSDLSSTPPVVVIQDRHGVPKKIFVPSKAKIKRGKKKVELADIKIGSKITIEYSYDVATGKRTAAVLSQGEEAPSSD